MCNTQKQKNSHYQAAYNRWAQTVNDPEHSIVPTSVIQNLFLGNEQDAHLDAQFYGATKVENGKAIGDYPDPNNGVTWDGPGQTTGSYNGQERNGWPCQIGYFSTAKNGVVATATYTNLKHSYYTDGANHKIPISKIVITYSNLERYLQDPGDAMLLLYNDPNVGAAIAKAKSITISNLQFFDQSGKQIEIRPGSAWLAFGSLNVWDYGSNKDYDGQTHREKVGVGNGNIIYQLGTPKGHNPIATLHSDGMIYHDSKSQTDEDYAKTDGDDGMGFVRLVPGGSIKLEYDQTDNFGSFGQSFDGTWAGTGPTGSFADRSGAGLDWYQFGLSTYLSGVHLPPAPKPTVSAIHYHYDVIAKRYLSRTISIKR